MFDYARALSNLFAKHHLGALKKMASPWTDKVDRNLPLSKHPRPQLCRQGFRILNGSWDYAILPDPRKGSGAGLDTLRIPERFQGQITVPFSPEADLSGVDRTVHPSDVLWYHRDITFQFEEGQRVLLHFEAVDFEMACFVNGTAVGTHKGGYIPFTFDITDYLVSGQEAQVAICVTDPSDAGTQPRGKQKLERQGIWYTAQSGIWQTVWTEMVPACHVRELCLDPDADAGILHVDLSLSAPLKDEVRVTVQADGATVATGTASPSSATEEDGLWCCRLDIPVDNPHLWSPEDPFLYDLAIQVDEDMVSSYCAFRTAAVETCQDGIKRFCLNHKPLFLKGLLDQGYWPDGLMTAPCDDALLFDIHAAFEMGFNMLRKHIKVESMRWYYHCDKLGMLVWQDMVSGGGFYPGYSTSFFPTVLSHVYRHAVDTFDYERFGSDDPEYRNEWEREALETVHLLKNHPCIVTWTIFNEGWGQFDAARMTRLVAKEDPTRPIDQASGWHDQGGGDYASFHNYFRPLTIECDVRKRACIISEFGGLTYHIPHHSSVEIAYGYKDMGSGEELLKSLLDLLEQADALEGMGASGYVYTQISDVEEETNGLLTYDRRFKFDPAEVRSALLD